MLKKISVTDKAQDALHILKTLSEQDFEDKRFTQVELCDLILSALDTIVTGRQSDIRHIRESFKSPSEKTLEAILEQININIKALSGGKTYQWLQNLGLPLGSRLKQALQKDILPLCEKIKRWHGSNHFELADLLELDQTWEEKSKIYKQLKSDYECLVEQHDTDIKLAFSNIQKTTIKFDQQTDYYAFLLKKQIMQFNHNIERLKTEINNLPTTTVFSSSEPVEDSFELISPKNKAPLYYFNALEKSLVISQQPDSADNPFEGLAARINTSSLRQPTFPSSMNPTS